MNALALHEMHGSLIAYKIRISKTNSNDKEVIFKATKSSKSKEDEKLDMEQSNFFQKLKRGQGKHKYKLPFKCFNYGGVGHYAIKFPYKVYSLNNAINY